MVNVVRKLCKECNSQPSFNLDGEIKPLYCTNHKKEGMVNVICKTCIECKIRPYFNVKHAKTAIYCFKHKKDGMVNVVSKPCVECDTLPSYNYKDNKTALYCATHKKEEMINVIAKICKNDWCSTRVQDKYDGYCLFCFVNLFPDKPVSRNYKTKETAVVEYIKTKFQNFTWICDKTINRGCSKRRPDLLLDFGYQIIIIEVDENQHIDYDCSCENKRIMEISKDVGHRSIVFIRFNPDAYNKNGSRISSCWGIDKRGMCTLKTSKKQEWDQRLNTLEEQIKYWTNPLNKTQKTIEMIRLFYNT